jgi:stage IV sporulation protein FB
MNGGFTLPKLFGFPITVSWTALIFLALIVGQNGVDTTPELFSALVFAGIVFGSILVHELGHALVATRIFHLGPASILLHGFGGLTSYRRAPEKSWHAFVTSLAGPSAGLLLGLVAIVIALVVPVSPRVEDLLHDVARINIFWSLFNLLPMLPMDGGSMLLHALQMVMAPSTADLVARWVSVPVAIAVGIAGWFVAGSLLIPLFAAWSIARNVGPRRA